MYIITDVETGSELTDWSKRGRKSSLTSAAAFDNRWNGKKWHKDTAGLPNGTNGRAPARCRRRAVFEDELRCSCWCRSCPGRGYMSPVEGEWLRSWLTTVGGLFDRCHPTPALNLPEIEPSGLKSNMHGGTACVPWQQYPDDGIPIRSSVG